MIPKISEFSIHFSKNYKNSDENYVPKKVTFVQQFGAVFRQLEHPLIDLSRDHDGTSCTVIHQNLSPAER